MSSLLGYNNGERKPTAADNEVVVYVEWHGELYHGSQEDALASQQLMAIVWLARRDELQTLWGDDWNDAPFWCNAGPPYDSQTPSLRKVEIYLGKALEAKQ